VKIAVHIRVGECDHVFAAVLLVPGDGLVALLGLSLSLTRGELHLLHLDLNLAEVIVSLSALFLFFLSAGGDGDLRSLVCCCWLLVCRFHSIFFLENIRTQSKVNTLSNLQLFKI